MRNKILVVSQNFWPNDSKINDICEGFAERGYKVDVLCGQPNLRAVGRRARRYKIPPKGRMETHNGIRIFRVKSAYGNGTGISLFRQYTSFAWHSLFRVRDLRKNKYDSVFMYQTNPVMAAVAGLRIGKKSGAEKVLYAVDVWPLAFYEAEDVRSSLFKRFLKQLSRWHYAQADRVIVTSDKNGRYLTEELEIPEDRVTCICEAPDSAYEHSRPDDNIMERYAGGFNALYIGEVSRNRNPMTLVDAADLMVRSGIRDIRFILAGDGPELDHVREEVNDRQLHDYFYFEDKLEAEDIPKYLHVADVLIGCFKGTGGEDRSISSEVISYMAAGKPLVLGISGQARQAIRLAKCGYACEAGDAQSFASNLKKVYKMSREERQRMGENARQYQQERFDRAATIEELLEEMFSQVDDHGYQKP